MSEELLARLNGDVTPGSFQALLGIRFVSAALDRIVAEMTVKAEHVSRPNVLHGGTIMAFADTVGGFAARINLPPACGTTTLESKTNFFRPAAPGTLLRAIATPLHIGRRTMVWQTVVQDEQGRLVAQTTQTQMVLPRS